MEPGSMSSSTGCQPTISGLDLRYGVNEGKSGNYDNYWDEGTTYKYSVVQLEQTGTQRKTPSFVCILFPTTSGYSHIIPFCSC